MQQITQVTSIDQVINIINNNNATTPTTTTPPPPPNGNTTTPGGGNTTTTTGGATPTGGADTLPPTFIFQEPGRIIAEMGVSQPGNVEAIYYVYVRDNVDGTAALTGDGPIPMQDNIGGDITISCNPPPRSLIPVGDTTVYCTVTDAAGNQAARSFLVRVYLTNEQLMPQEQQSAEEDATIPPAPAEEEEAPPMPEEEAPMEEAPPAEEEQPPAAEEEATNQLTT